MTVVRRLTEGDGVQLVEDTVLQRLTVSARRDVVAYLADLANGSRVDRGAGVMAFNPLLDYPVGSVGARIKAIITGIGAGQPWGDVDALLADLDGRISLVQLDSPLQGEIDKISASVSEIGSVNQRLQVEQLARVQALQDEATARGNAINLALDGCLGLAASHFAGQLILQTGQRGFSDDRAQFALIGVFCLGCNDRIFGCLGC